MRVEGRKPIPKQSGPRMAWSGDAGMHVSVQSAGEARNDAHKESLIRVMEDVFQCHSVMRYSKLIFTLKTTVRVSQSTVSVTPGTSG